MEENKFIFMSYSHKDSDKVYPLIEFLTKNNFGIWYDDGIEAGSEWPEFIAEKLMNSTVVVVMLSKNALESHNCRREINFAIECKKDILVAYLEGVELTPGMRMQLNTLQAIHRNKFANDEEFAKALMRSRILMPCKAAEENIPEPPKVISEEKIPEPPKVIAEEKIPELPKVVAEEKKPASSTAEDLKIDIDEIFSGFMTSGTSVKSGISKEIITEKTEKREEKAAKSYGSFAIEKVIKEFNLSAKYKLVDRNVLKGSKIRNILKNVAEGSGETENDIVAFRDLTILESGKEGFLFTKTAMYYKYIGDSFSVRYNDIAGIEKGEKGINFCLKNGNVVGMSGTSLFELDKFMAIFAAYKGIEKEEFESVIMRQGGFLRYAIACANKAVTGTYFSADDGLVFAEMVSEKKKENALKCIAGNAISYEQIVAFADTTVMGSGKDGYVVTEGGIYCKTVSGSHYIDFNELISVRHIESEKTIVVSLKYDEIRIYASFNCTKVVFELLNFILSYGK